VFHQPDITPQALPLFRSLPIGWFLSFMETLADRGYYRPYNGYPTQSVSVSFVTVPVTVTATASETSTSTSTTHSTTPSSSSHSTSVPTTALVSSTSSKSNIANANYITTTYLTSQGTSLFTTTAIVSNPAGEVQDQSNAPSGALFNNRAETIGVFTTVGIVAFAIIAALVAWAARRRTLKRRRKEAEESNSRGFFEDETNDAGAPSEKSWWGNTSGASIPEGGGVPLKIVTSGGYDMAPPVPPLPFEFSPSSAVPASVTSKSPSLSDAELTLPHPYAGTGSFADSYSNNSVTYGRDGGAGIGWIFPVKDAFRSSPSAPLSYKNAASNNATYLPSIHEGAPVSSSSHPSSAANHPFTSPPMNRKSELYPEDVLWGLGNSGGVGRSLSGKRPGEPPEPLIPADPFSSPQSQTSHQAMVRQQPSYLLYPADGSHVHDKASPVENSQMIPEHSDHNLSDNTIRPTSGISEGGWYRDSNSELGGAALAGATASRESFSNTGTSKNERYAYPYTAPGGNRSHVEIARDKSTTTSRKMKVPHDPRLSGLFGNVVPGLRSGSLGRPSEDFDQRSVVDELP